MLENLPSKIFGFGLDDSCCGFCIVSIVTKPFRRSGDQVRLKGMNIYIPNRVVTKIPCGVVS